MDTKTFTDNTPFEQRREKLGQLCEDAVFIFFSGEEGHLAPFRPRSSFVYFTAFEEPSAAVVLRTGRDASFTLFVRDKDPDIELWDGFRFGPELAKKEFSADAAYSIKHLSQELPTLINGAKKVYYSLGEDAEQDKIVMQALAGAQQMNRGTGYAKQSIGDPNQIVSRLRMVKDDLEIECLKDSGELSANAHVHVMKSVTPSMNERQVQAHLYFSFYNQMASREGYSSIIASGPNACTLHYRANNRQMQDGDFLLIDAGAEKRYYTADITRTYPVNGQFTSAQKDIYQATLDVQKSLIDMCRPGLSLPELHNKSVKMLTQKMVDLKLLKGSVEQLIEDKSYRKYYPHRIGHYIGMDVHDLGFSGTVEDPTPFEKNMAITVEPGLYVPPGDESAPKELRGLGVRIEDDILLQEGSPLNLTEKAPKEIDQLEAIIGK